MCCIHLRFVADPQIIQHVPLPAVGLPHVPHIAHGDVVGVHLQVALPPTGRVQQMNPPWHRAPDDHKQAISVGLVVHVQLYSMQEICARQ